MPGRGLGHVESNHLNSVEMRGSEGIERVGLTRTATNGKDAPRPLRQLATHSSPIPRLAPVTRINEVIMDAFEIKTENQFKLNRPFSTSL